MPPRRRYRRRRRARARAFRGRQTAPLGWRLLNPRPSLNYHKYRLTAVIDIVTDGVSGTLGSVNYWFKNYNLDACAVRVQGPTVVTGLSDITSIKNLFDVYRTQYIRMKFTPRFDKGASTSENGVLNGIPACYVSHDPDNENVNQAKELLVQKTNTKRFDMSRPFTYSWKPKRLSNGGKTDADVFQGGWINLQDTLPSLGEVQMKTDPWLAGPTGTPLNGVKVGEMLLEYYVEFKSRR